LSEKRRRFPQLLLRDIDWDINSGLFERLDDNPRLGTCASTKPDQFDIRPNLRCDFGMMATQNIDLRAGDVILWQFADFLEQRCAALIVEILARQGAWIGRKAGDHVRQQIRSY